MAIKLEDKKAIVAEVNEAAKAGLSAVVADARGVTVGDSRFKCQVRLMAYADGAPDSLPNQTPKRRRAPVRRYGKNQE